MSNCTPNRLRSASATGRSRYWLLPAPLLLCAGQAIAASHTEVEDLMEMSLESLMDIQVTTVSKTAQSLSQTAASVYVISRADIRRSGATTIPEALRLAPGMEIANIDGNKTAMAIRGFNSAGSSNKLLVMIDGRVAYTALMSGVFWQHQDTLMADIDRIEVVRGPGATMWGANAVNGVINIITRDTADSHGGLVEGIGGNDPIGVHSAVRYGGEINSGAHYRVYGKYMDRGEFRTPDGNPANDDRHTGQIGGRVDWRAGDRDHITVQGDFYDGGFRQNLIEQPPLLDPVTFEPLSGVSSDSGDIRGGNLLFRWQHTYESGDESGLQFYYDRLEREDMLVPHTTDTLDVDYQHSFAINDRFDALWGFGYRYVNYDFDTISHIKLSPSSGDTNTFSGFIQGSYNLTDTLRLTLGSKFEHNDFTGFEYQPSIRMLWQLHENHSLWSSVSRAVRTPALFDIYGRTDLFAIDGALPILFSSFGNQGLEAEELIAYELGYRTQITSTLSLDTSLFYNQYDNLVNFEPDPDPVFEPPHLLFRFDADNQIKGHTYGLDLSTEWQLSERLRMEAGYSLTRPSMRAKSSSLDTFTPESIEKASPQQQFQVRSYLNLPHNIEFDVSLYWVDRLAGEPDSFITEVEDYARLDLHLGWRPTGKLSLDLFVRNALDSRHAEYRGGFTEGSEVPRSVFGRIRWNW